MRKKLLVVLLVMAMAFQSAFACTIFAVGKAASIDGATITSHTCDSTGDDLRLWLIPSMPAGTERDLVLNGRQGADYSRFPEVKDYGLSGMVLGSYTHEQETNRYLHGMYSFLNDKGLSMGECTCWFDFKDPNAKKLAAVGSRDEGILDLYMLQDLALEHCSTAREAVKFIGQMIEEYGWNGAPETVNIGDGNEVWAFEAYGGHIWCAVRVPDDMVFVAANRSRINNWVDNDENYLSCPNLKSFAIEEGLWDGKSKFIPCRVYDPNPKSTYSTHREWIAMMTLNPLLNLDPNDPDPDRHWPLFVKPQRKVSVDDIFKLSSNYYEGTEFDLSKSIEAGRYGNPLVPQQKRSINSFRCTYIQIASVRADLPEDVRCLAYFGWGAPVTTYLTPVFASQKSLPPWFGKGIRQQPYSDDSGWWVSSRVQQLSTINFRDAIQRIREVRDPKMDEQYKFTAIVQDMAAKMIRKGDREGALDLLTWYSSQQAAMWRECYIDLGDELLSTYMHGNKNMGSADATDAWKAYVEKATK